MGSGSQTAYRSTAAWVLAASAYIYAIWMCGSSPQAAFYSILTAAVTAFCAYAYFCLEKPTLPFIIVVGLLARISLIALFPSLSDDIYRFFWDGKLTAAGYNPYSYLPSALMEQSNTIPELTPALFAELNSPDYYTIYPPVSQLIFLGSSFWAANVADASIGMKVLFLVAEIATLAGLLRLLAHMQKPAYLAALYWLNPLVIVEGMGNLHFEIIMVALLCWSMYFVFVRKHLYIAAVLLSLSVATKLLPLMLLPYFFFKMSKVDRNKLFGVFTLVTILLFLPIFFGVQIANFASSIDLYFQKFEFNGSIYNLLRAIGHQLSGYNLIYYIGPLLGITAVGLILTKAIKASTFDCSTATAFNLYAFTAYLLLATTVHPWYLITPIFLAALTPYRFVYFWSALIVLTYINYSYVDYQENLGIVAVEYTMVFSILIWESRRFRIKGDETKD